MDSATSRLWLMRGLYLFLALTVMFFHLLPLNTQPGRLPFPDFLICLTFAWVLRRPEYVPTLSIAAVMLMADLLLQRPPGLLAASVVIGSAYLRSAGPGMRDVGFVGEWTTVGVVIAAIFAFNRTILALLSVSQASIGPVFVQVVFTVLAYPLVVAFSQTIFGVRRPSAVDVATVGTRS